MNDEIIYETVSVRFSEGGDPLKMEDICIEFLYQDTHVSILLNGIDRTDILRRLLAFESTYRPVKLLAFKLESIFNKSKYNSLPQSLLKGLVGKSDFHSIQLSGDTDIIKKLTRLSENNFLDLTSESKSQSLTFQSLISAIKSRLYKRS